VFAPELTFVLVDGQCVASLVHVVKFGMVELPQLSKQYAGAPSETGTHAEVLIFVSSANVVSGKMFGTVKRLVPPDIVTPPLTCSWADAGAISSRRTHIASEEREPRRKSPRRLRELLVIFGGSVSANKKPARWRVRQCDDVLSVL
jgi:hypothetical protein